jgi:glycosyltransferase involved in cell wall biosynthesis
MRVCYFGTYERDYPRNRHVISALRRAGVDVTEVHVDIWGETEHKYGAGPRLALRAVRAQIALLLQRRKPFDALIVGYPGHPDMLVARLVARRRPLVFNPLVSLKDTFVDDRARFAPGSAAARMLELTDRAAIWLSDLTVADTEAHAAYMAQLARVPPERLAVCFVGAEEHIFRPPWQPREVFTCVFAGKFSPLHGLEAIIDAAHRIPETPFRIIGTGQLDDQLAAAPANVDWVRWLDLARLGDEYRAAGAVLGIFGTTGKAARVIPNKVFQALACGAPVVTADTPAARELLRDGHDALLVPPGDGEALGRAIGLLRDDPDFAQTIAANGHVTYRRRASESVLGERWRQLLEDVIEMGTPSQRPRDFRLGHP